MGLGSTNVGPGPEKIERFPKKLGNVRELLARSRVYFLPDFFIPAPKPVDVMRRAKSERRC